MDIKFTQSAGMAHCSPIPGQIISWNLRMGYPNGRTVAGPFCCIEYSSWGPAYDEVLHAHGTHLLSTDIDVELDRTELDGNVSHCYLNDDIFMNNPRMVQLSQLGDPDYDT